MALKPLKMLEDAKTQLPTFATYYLRELYLKKNLSFEHEQNKIVFKDINDPYLLDYLLDLMASNLDFGTLLANIQTLDIHQLRNMLPRIVKHAETRLGLSSEEVIEYLTEADLIDTVQDQVFDLQSKVVIHALERQDYQKAFT